MISCPKTRGRKSIVQGLIEVSINSDTDKKQEIAVRNTWGSCRLRTQQVNSTTERETFYNSTSSNGPVC